MLSWFGRRMGFHPSSSTGDRTADGKQPDGQSKTEDVDRTAVGKQTDGESETEKEAIRYDVAMRRLVYVACFGAFIISASGFHRWGFSSGVGVGFAGKQSDAKTVGLIVDDLKVARTEREKWKGWVVTERDLKNWFVLNKIDPDTLC